MGFLVDATAQSIKSDELLQKLEIDRLTALTNNTQEGIKNFSEEFKKFDLETSQSKMIEIMKRGVDFVYR